MELVKHPATVTRAADIPRWSQIARWLLCQLDDGSGVGESVPADGAGEDELSVEAGSGDEVAGDGLLAGDGLSVVAGVLAADGLPADGLLVGDGAAGSDVAGELTGDGCAVGAGAGTGGVAPAAEAGNSVITGSTAAALCLAAGDAAGAGVDDGEATVWICGPSRPRGLTAALVVAAPGKAA
jgi:hypothetical protein